jgi:hypothetical protein
MTSHSPLFLYEVGAGEPTEDARLQPAFADDKSLVLEQGESIRASTNLTGMSEQRSRAEKGLDTIWSRERELFDLTITNHRLVYAPQQPVKQRSMGRDQFVFGLGSGTAVSLAKKARNKHKYSSLVVGGQLRFEHMQAVGLALTGPRLTDETTGVVVGISDTSDQIAVVNLTRTKQGLALTTLIARLAAERQMHLHQDHKTEEGLVKQWPKLQKQATSTEFESSFLGQTAKLPGCMNLDSSEPTAISRLRDQPQ